jgi:DNA segregation ATPase FtsK/SpoIIIE-like protein
MMSEDREMMLEAERAMGALKQIILKGRQAGFFAIIATQNVKADDLPSTFKDNIMTRISVGRLSQFSYEVIFGKKTKINTLSILNKLMANVFMVVVIMVYLVVLLESFLS